MAALEQLRCHLISGAARSSLRADDGRKFPIAAIRFAAMIASALPPALPRKAADGGDTRAHKQWPLLAATCFCQQLRPGSSRALSSLSGLAAAAWKHHDNRAASVIFA